MKIFGDKAYHDNAGNFKFMLEFFERYVPEGKEFPPGYRHRVTDSDRFVTGVSLASITNLFAANHVDRRIDKLAYVVNELNLSIEGAELDFEVMDDEASYAFIDGDRYLPETIDHSGITSSYVKGPSFTEERLIRSLQSIYPKLQEVVFDKCPTLHLALIPGFWGDNGAIVLDHIVLKQSKLNHEKVTIKI
jgi:hypothetical protein